MALSRKVAWSLAILAPPLTVAGILVLGDTGRFDPEDVPAVDVEVPDPEVEPLPPVRTLELDFVLPDGRPAEGARVVLLEPELAVAVTGPDGRARLWHQGGGPFRIQAWFPGHRLLGSGPWDEPPPAALAFEFLEDSPRPAPLEVERPRRLRLVSTGDGRPLAGALVLAAGEDELVPWMGRTGAGGVVTFPGARRVRLQVEVYAPGLPPEEAWLLAVAAVDAGAGFEEPVEAPVTWCRVRIPDLPPGRRLTGERLDLPASLPLLRIPDDGRWARDGLPPGRYRFTAAGRVLEADLEPGENELAFPQS